MSNQRDRKSNEPYRELNEIRASELNVNAQSTSRYNNNFDDSVDRSLELSSIAVIPDDTFTVAQAINALGFGRFQVKLSLFTGLCWMVDSMEITILSILSPSLNCDWGITRYQQALTTTVVFLGMMLSSTFWCNLSDRYGKKQALTLCAVLLFYFAFLSAFAPNFLWILLLRGLVGFAIGCVPQSVTLYAEFLPAKQRAKCVILLDCFWALGACFEVAIALAIMPNFGWRWLLILSTVPLFVFAIITPWLPESAIFDMTTGKTDKAVSTLERVARENKKPLPLGRLIMDRFYRTNRGRFMDVLSKEMCKTSSLLWLREDDGIVPLYILLAQIYSPPLFKIYPNFSYDGYCLLLLRSYFNEDGIAPLYALLAQIYSPPLFTNYPNFSYASLSMATAFCYYGVVLMTTELFRTSSEQCGSLESVDRTDEICQLNCRLKRSDYIDLLWTTLAEFPGIFCTIFAIGKIGRRKTMACQLVMFSMIVCFLGKACLPSRALLTIGIFLARGLIAGVFQAAYVYTPELYPTHLRSVGVSTCSAMARIGAMVTPYVAQVFLQWSIIGAMATYAIAALCAAIATLALPIETKDQQSNDPPQNK